MRTRPCDRPANRSGSTARRASAIAIAAAVVVVPILAASPAYADASVVVNAGFSATEVTVNGVAQGVFSGGDDPFFAEGFDACMFEYKNGIPLATNSLAPIATATAPYANGASLVDAGFVVGDTYTVAYADATDLGGDPVCDAPALDAAGIVTASIDLAAAPAPAPELPVSAAPISLTQGVAFSQVLSLTLDGGFDFSAGGWVAAGPQSSAGLENGELNPLEGISFEYIGENMPGVTPTIRAYGTPRYSGSITTGFVVGDGTSVGFGPISFSVSGANGITGPIQIEAAIGQPVAGAGVTIIASGLRDGAAWDVTVRSTSGVVGSDSGTIALGGQLAQRMTLPAGLAAGAYTITVTSTNADGTPYSAVLYFTVSATGTLLAVSVSGLPDTGADAHTSLFLAGGLLLAGLAFAGVAAYRRRTA